MAEPRDPLGAPNPDDPWWVPDDWPRFTDPTPMPEPAEPGTCPHCGAVWLSGKAGHATEDDIGVCATCCGLCVATESGWRIATYDESEVWDQDPRVKAMRAIWGQPLPTEE